MNTMHSVSSFLTLKPWPLILPPSGHSNPLSTSGRCPKTNLHSSHSIKLPLTSPNPSRARQFSNGATFPSNQETVSAVHVEDLMEKDWSFLDFEDPNLDGEHAQKIDRIISAGNISKTSKVLVSISSESFVDRLVSSSPCEQLLILHDSLFILACIKEKHDKVKCWQGELINIPDKWTTFDVVFLYCLPALTYELDQILSAIAKRCLPGARLVISHPQGRQVVEEQRQQYPDVVVSNLPTKMAIQNTAAQLSFQLLEYVDEPGFYLAVLRL